jgi:hypothetical protein
MKLKPFPRTGLPVALVFIFTASQLRAELPPESEEAMKNGLQAAKQHEWKTAIQSFQEARKIAPNAPELFYNLGLAESRIPGRELRAIAWFSAYLAANTSTPNAAAIKDQIHVLDMKSRSNVSRLIKSLQDVAVQIHNVDPSNDAALEAPAWCWAFSGDHAAAKRIVALMHDPYWRSNELQIIATFEAGRTDSFAESKKTMASALKTAYQIQSEEKRNKTLLVMAEVQDSLKEGEATRKKGHSPVHTPVSDWLKKLDDTDSESLNRDPFFELASYLKSLSSSDNPERAYISFSSAIKDIVGMQAIIEQMAGLD